MPPDPSSCPKQPEQPGAVRTECPWGEGLLAQVQVRRARGLCFSRRRSRLRAGLGWCRPGRVQAVWGRWGLCLPSRPGCLAGCSLSSPSPPPSLVLPGVPARGEGSLASGGGKDPGGRQGECGENGSHSNLHVLLLDRAGPPRYSSPESRRSPWLLGYLFSYLFALMVGVGGVG